MYIHIYICWDTLVLKIWYVKDLLNDGKMEILLLGILGINRLYICNLIINKIFLFFNPKQIFECYLYFHRSFCYARSNTLFWPTAIILAIDRVHMRAYVRTFIFTPGQSIPPIKGPLVFKEGSPGLSSNFCILPILSFVKIHHTIAFWYFKLLHIKYLIICKI